MEEAQGKKFKRKIFRIAFFSVNIFLGGLMDVETYTGNHS